MEIIDTKLLPRGLILSHTWWLWGKGEKERERGGERERGENQLFTLNQKSKTKRL